MRILIVRHGDPDYEIDSLTEKGWGEARASGGASGFGENRRLLCITPWPGEGHGVPDIKVHRSYSGREGMAEGISGADSPAGSGR